MKRFTGFRKRLNTMRVFFSSWNIMIFIFPNSHRVNTIYGEISDIDLDNQIVSVGQTKVDYS
jgi:NADH dehydrogenase FAD-containing subunit